MPEPFAGTGTGAGDGVDGATDGVAAGVASGAVAGGGTTPADASMVAAGAEPDPPAVRFADVRPAHAPPNSNRVTSSEKRVAERLAAFISLHIQRASVPDGCSVAR